MGDFDSSPRGSEWRKWDLHVHTPFSCLNNQFGNDFDAYVKQLFTKAIEKEIAVIGITDYFCIEGYKKIITEYRENEDKLKELFTDEAIEKIKNITLFPNIEFRINIIINNKKINFHVLFSDTVSIKDIEENFLHDLHFVSEGNPLGQDEACKLKLANIDDLGKKLKAEHEKFRKDSDRFVGMNCISIDSTDISKILESRSIFQGEYILCVPADEDLSKVSWDGQGHNIRKIIIQKSSALISSNNGTIDFGLGKTHPSPQEFIHEFKSLKPCFWGSDAHEYEKLFEPDYNKYTWIKADTTFEGLKQITYEPAERVRIQCDNPSFEFNKPYFKELSINNEIGIFIEPKDQVYFMNTTLPLNKHLVTIIGGRGQGKSMLVDYWAGIFANHRAANKNLTALTEDPNFKIRYAKDNILIPSEENYIGGSDNYLDYIYIPQRRLKEISGKNVIGDEVKKLLKVEELYFSPAVDLEIQNTLNVVDELRAWFNKENEEGQKSNSKDFALNIKRQSEEFLKSITTAANQPKLDIYTANISEVKELELRISSLNAFADKLKRNQMELNESIELINAQMSENEGYNIIPLLDFGNQIGIIFENSSKAVAIKEQKEEQNRIIRSDFEIDGFTGDLSSLLDNAKTYQSQIKWADEQLRIVSQKELDLQKALDERDALGKKIELEYMSQKDKINSAWSGVLSQHQGGNRELIKKILLKDGEIAVHGDIFFNKQAFYEKFHALVDRRKYRTIQSLMDEFPINSFEDWIDFVSTRLRGLLVDETTERLYEIRSLFFDLKERSKYIKTAPIISYRGKPSDRLSVGQRGTAYLCLKLATDAFSKPIVFDQPDDDLDNEFIMKELIDIFKELKKYRQIIIVTHNANLVVNADAEQVVVANNTDEKLSYVSGSLENQSIVTSVCGILEGGKIAFEKRRTKYSKI